MFFVAVLMSRDLYNTRTRRKQDINRVPFRLSAWILFLYQKVVGLERIMRMNKYDTLTWRQFALPHKVKNTISFCFDLQPRNLIENI